MTLLRVAPLVVGALALVAVAVVLAGQAAGQRVAEGIVVGVESAGLADVRAFTLRSDDGAETTYRIGPLENATEFPPGHLAEHRATTERVRVFYRERDGQRVAYRLEDAGG